MLRRLTALSALITPFSPKGNIDYAALARNLEFQIATSNVAFVATGTTGESSTLSFEEHLCLVTETVNTVKRRRLVLAGTGANNTTEAIHLTRSAMKLGADGVLLVDPYYNRPPSCQILTEYYWPVIQVALAENPRAIIVPYVIPGRTATALLPADLKRLRDEFPNNVIGFKDATGSLDHAKEVRRQLGHNFFILSGDDSASLQMMMDVDIDADGVVSVIANVFPKQVSDMVSLALADNWLEAKKIDDALQPIFNCVTVSIPNPDDDGKTQIRFPNPEAIKAMMAILGMDTGLLRRPLATMHLQAVAIVHTALQKLFQKHPEFFEGIALAYGVDISQRLTGKCQTEAK